MKSDGLKSKKNSSMVIKVFSYLCPKKHEIMIKYRIYYIYFR